MPPRTSRSLRSSGATCQGAFVRPLLRERKSALQAYLQAIGQQWMEDSSNAKLKYKRNRVRLQVRNRRVNPRRPQPL